jgi:predicted RNA-binding Zn-ribbon protein involved in translation (DUF1610 family)
MTEKTKVDPCNAACPKCGSADIYRQFYAKGKRIDNEEYDVPPCDWTTGQCYAYKASRDLIKHHCRCCEHDFVTKPLK